MLNRIIFLFICLVNTLQLSAQIPETRLDRSIYIIQSFLEHTSDDYHSKELFQKILKQKRTGIFLNIKEENNNLKIFWPDKSKSNIKEILGDIEKQLSTQRSKILPLFIQLDGEISLLKAALDKADLDKYLLDLNEEEELPLITDVRKYNKRLILFVDYDKSFQIKGLTPFKKYIQYNDQDSEERPDNDINFLMIRKPHSQDHIIDLDGLRFGHESKYINMILEEWRRNCIFPSFLLTSNANVNVQSLIEAVNNTPYVEGDFNFVDTTGVTIYFEEHNTSTNRNRFILPIDKPDIKTITPSCPGFQFTPSSFSFEYNQLPVMQSFQSRRLMLEENMVSFYPFEDDLKDITQRNHPKNIVGTRLIDDPMKQKVLSISKGDFVELPDVKRFNLKDNSLTISAWVNYSDDGSGYFPVLCNNEKLFRKGLQLAIRNKKAYFGFWNLDLIGNREIRPNSWHHFVGRFDKTSQKISIYVDGKLDSEQDNFLSFLGGERLFLGRSPVGHNFQGKIDDLIIWDRALADFEIEQLYKNGVQKSAVPKQRKEFFIILIILIVGLIIFTTIRILLKRKAGKKKGETAVYDYEISLFGNFKFTDSANISLPQKVSPKSRNLFLLLLMESYQKDKGINSSRISELLWPDLDHNKAMNNRRVTTNRLKNYLTDVNEIEILQDDHMNMSVKISDRVNIDYFAVMDMAKQGVLENIHRVVPILKKGPFLKDTVDEWADSYKSKAFDLIIEPLVQILINKSCKEELLIDIADIIQLNDPVNEDALAFKLKYFVEKGNSKMTQSIFDHFCENYRKFYGEDYSKEMKELL